MFVHAEVEPLSKEKEKKHLYTTTALVNGIVNVRLTLLNYTK